MKSNICFFCKKDFDGHSEKDVDNCLKTLIKEGVSDTWENSEVLNQASSTFQNLFSLVNHSFVNSVNHIEVNYDEISKKLSK